MTIGCSHLTNFPGSMKKLSKLKCLWLGGRKLKAVPLFIEHRAGTLEHLHIYRSNIESLPAFVFKLTKLQTMTILVCHLLLNIPESINGLKGTLKDLRFIHFSGLKRLPESLGDLTNVEMLNVQACQHLEALPKTLGRLSKLQTLELNGCEDLVEFPDAESISNLSRRCREKICKFRCEQNIMAGRYDAAEQNVKYLMTLRFSDPIFKKLYELINEKKHNLKSELASLSTDMEWLRQQAWQKVVVNDMQQAAVLVDKMVEVDPESEFVLLCRSTLRTLVGDLKGSEADTKKMLSDRARRKQAGVELPQLYPDSLKKWKPFMDKLDSRGALLAIHNVRLL
jgi:hypothetical protein